MRIIDIAHAANVSEQTVYNYFPTKEHLIFDMDQDFEARIIKIVVGRSSKTSLTAALRAGSLEFLKEASRSVGKETGLSASVVMGPALRRVWVEMNARHADSLAQALIRNSNGRMHRATAKILARCIVAIFAVILEEVGLAAMAAEEPHSPGAGTSSCH